MRDLRFSLSKQKLAADFYGQFDITPQPAIIRIEENLVNGQGNYSFDIKKATRSATERSINYNDLFIVDSHLVALMVEKDDRKGAAQLLTYPLVHNDALPVGTAGFTTTDVRALYNGDLVIKNDSAIVYKSFPMLAFLRVPRTQPVQIVNADGSALISAGLAPEFNLSDALVPITEVLGFAGNHTIDISINAPVVQAASFAVPAGYTAKVVYIAYGWLMTGAANDKYKVDANPVKDLI